MTAEDARRHEFGQRIRNARRDRRMTQPELAALISARGVETADSVVGDYEFGLVIPDAAAPVWVELEQALEIDLSDLRQPRSDTLKGSDF